jgi:hypothetical protein
MTNDNIYLPMCNITLNNFNKSDYLAEIHVFL